MYTKISNIYKDKNVTIFHKKKRNEQNEKQKE